MQFTILSDKLLTLSEEPFAYEFRVMHARETRTMAINLGIIQKYVQGLALPTAGRPQLTSLPLEEGGQHGSFAQLTWPYLKFYKALSPLTTIGKARRSTGLQVLSGHSRLGVI